MLNSKQSGHPPQPAAIDAPLILAAQEEKAFYQALVASVSDMGQGMLIIQNRRYRYVNPAICEMLGYSAEQMLAWEDFTPAFYPDVRSEIMQKHLRRLAGETFSPCYETAFIHHDRHRIEVEISVAFMRNVTPAGVVITVRDISERKRAEDVIRHKNADLELMKTSLEKKVRQRTQEIERANRELRQLNQVKSDFISIVSHELRTPLTSIKSFAEILLDDLGEHTLDTQKRYLSIINSETDRLSRLISDVLDLQKIDSGNIVWNDEILNVIDVARAAVGLLKGAYRKKGITLDLEAESEFLMTEAETDRILQLISNLLSNALKFTEKGCVTLRLHEVPTAGDAMIEISVRDTGIGIPPEELGRIFDRFYQVDSSQSRHHEGAGLGLSICKDIAEHYQGALRVESELGQGSCFFLTLPVLKQPQTKLRNAMLDLGMLTEADLKLVFAPQPGLAAQKD